MSDKNKLSRAEIHEQIKARISKEMAEKHEKGEAVWQLSDEKKEAFFLPINPVFNNGKDKNGEQLDPGRYFHGGNAMYLMQKAHDYAGADGKMDSRWMSVNDLKKYNVKLKENADVVSIPVGQINKDNGYDSRAFAKVVNFSQLEPYNGKNLPRAVFQDKYRDHGKLMLLHNSFSVKPYVQAEDGSLHRNHEASEEYIKTEEVEKGFFDIARKAYIAACILKANAKNFAEEKKAEYNDGVALFNDLIKEKEGHLLTLDVSGSRPKSKEKAFEYDLATNAQKCAEANEGKLTNKYVYDTVKDSMLGGLSEKDVAKYITKYAPESVKDDLKLSVGRTGYSSFVMSQLKEDKKFQQQLNEAKSKNAAKAM